MNETMTEGSVALDLDEDLSAHVRDALLAADAERSGDEESLWYDFSQHTSSSPA